MKKILYIILIFILIFAVSCSKKNDKVKEKNMNDKNKTQLKTKEKTKEEIEKEKNTKKELLLKSKFTIIRKLTEAEIEATKQNYMHNLPLNTKGLEVVKGFINAETIKNPNILKKIDHTTLINKFNSLPENYKQKNLKEINSNIYRKILLQKDAANQYEKMRKDAQKQGITFVVFSGWRSHSLQKSLYWGYFKKDKLDAIVYSAYPRRSEHETGYALDISYNENFPKDFYNTKHGKYLLKNAHNYGFILRYPKDKEHITNYKYESWHYRYVGVKLAKILKEKNITLEEYYGTDKPSKKIENISLKIKDEYIEDLNKIFKINIYKTNYEILAKTDTAYKVVIDNNFVLVDKSIVKINEVKDQNIKKIENKTTKNETKNNKTLIINTDVLNARENPTTDSKIITTFKRGEKLEYFEVKNNWYKVKKANQYLWISGDYIKKE